MSEYKYEIGHEFISNNMTMIVIDRFIHESGSPCYIYYPRSEPHMFWHSRWAKEDFIDECASNWLMKEFMLVYIKDSGIICELNNDGRDRWSFTADDGCVLAAVMCKDSVFERCVPISNEFEGLSIGNYVYGSDSVFRITSETERGFMCVCGEDEVETILIDRNGASLRYGNSKQLFWRNKHRAQKFGRR